MSDERTVTDWEGLMCLVQEGNKEAYSQMLDKLYRLLLAYLNHRISNHVLREDLVQEIILAVHKARHTYDPKQPFLPWLLAIARYKMIDTLRKTKRQHTDNLDENQALSTAFVDPENQVDTIHNRMELEDYLKIIPAHQQKVIRLVKLEGYSIKDTAKKLEMSVSNVKISVHRALHIMKRKHHE